MCPGGQISGCAVSFCLHLGCIHVRRIHKSDSALTAYWLLVTGHMPPSDICPPESTIWRASGLSSRLEFTVIALLFVRTVRVIRVSVRVRGLGWKLGILFGIRVGLPKTEFMTGFGLLGIGND